MNIKNGKKRVCVYDILVTKKVEQIFMYAKQFRIRLKMLCL